jgi:hypothetical protein
MLTIPLNHPEPFDTLTMLRTVLSEVEARSQEIGTGML